MKRIVFRPAKATAEAPGHEQQLTFALRPSTRAQRLATGELRAVVAAQAQAAGFRWPLAVSARLWADVETVPSTYRHRESTARRWHDVLLLTAATAAELLRRGGDDANGQPSAISVKVILRTTTAPEKAREHLKTLRLLREHEAAEAGGGSTGANFTLGYPEEFTYNDD